MTEIYLRTYIQEIDDLIDEGQQLEEAIAHCRHILKSYPKHIDTYRLLGKAYLESKRFGDSGDIFQRVLSAIPNDFVSHVGMAIIREDEGNLDAAIWHMERGSESQPGNAAIEEELKRLIGKRDGIEPQRVRPTRGALARMYYHGELYSYAISELQTALEEDPDRPDLQLLLADAYWRTDQRLEAADLCGQILEKLPYCFLANQITAALLQASGKPEESAINLRRLIALDPYMAFIESPMDNPATIDASAIQLERLTWRPGQPMPSSEAAQPDWAASLGVDLRSEQAKAADQEEMPSWLKSPPATAEEGIPQEATAIHPFAGAKPPPGAEIPDWMKEAGWVESSGEATAGPTDLSEVSGTEEGPPTLEGPLEAADLPSWLREISPERPLEEEAVPIPEPATPEDEYPLEADDTEGLPDWIQGITPAEEEEEELEFMEELPEEEPGLEKPPFELEPSEPELQEEVEVSELEEIVDESLEEEIPEYPPWLEPSTPGATDTIVSWLGDKSLEETTMAEDIPTWMRGTGPLEEPSRRAKIPPDQEVPEAPLAEPSPTLEGLEEIPEELGEPIPEEELPISAVPLSESTPDWLDEISGFEEELPTKDTVPPEEAPAWLAEEAARVEEIPTMEEVSPPSWLDELEEEFEEEAVGELVEAEEGLESLEKPPDWLSEVISEDILEDEGKIVEKPDWLAGVVDTESIVEEEAAEDLEEAPEWLTEISMVEEVDTSPISEDQEEPPEWLKGLAETETVSMEEEEIVAEEAPPDWVTQESFPEPEEEIIADQETPEWLLELTEPTSVVEEPSDISIETPAAATPAEEQIEPPMDLGEVPLEAKAVGEEAIEEPTAVPPVEEPLPQAEVPDWLEDIEEVPVEEEPIPQAEIPDWLEDLAEAPVEEEPILEEPVSEEMEPSLEEEALPAAEMPQRTEEMEAAPIPDELVIEERMLETAIPSDELEAIPAEEAPDWLQDMIGIPSEELTIEEPSEEIAESVPGEEFATEAEAVDWLKEISEAPSQVEPTPAEELEKIPEPALPEDEAPIWLEEIEEVETEAAAIEEEVTPEPPWVGEEVPERILEFPETPSDLAVEAVEELEEIREDLFPAEPVDIAAPSEAIEETVEGAPLGEEVIPIEGELEGEELIQETPEWLQEIELREEEVITYPTEEVEHIEELTAEAEMVAEEMEEKEPQLQPESEEEERLTEIAPPAMEGIDFEAPKTALEESFDWLQESAMEVTPEPEAPIPSIEPGYEREEVEEFISEIEEPLDDEEVFSFLDQLAAREASVEAEAPPEQVDFVDSTLITGQAEEKLIEEHALPEELDESLDWLEQLAGEEPVEDFSPPVFVEGLEEEEEAEIPDWLEEVAEKPEEVSLEEIREGEVEGREEPAPTTPEPSTMETMISKRPEEILREQLAEERPEEKLTEPLPTESFPPDQAEAVWTLEVEGKPPSVEEVPQEIPEPEFPTEEISEITPEVSPEKVPEERAAPSEEMAYPEEEPIMDPHAAKLSEARHSLESGEIEVALAHYSDLIEEKAEMTAVIQDLRNAIEKTPREPMLWQILGDALMKIGQLSDAIDAYRRGMEAV